MKIPGRRSHPVVGVGSILIGVAATVFALALGTSSAQPTGERIGEITWFERFGIGVPLPEAPGGDSGTPRLLAASGKYEVEGVSFWRLESGVLDGLVDRLGGRGPVPAPSAGTFNVPSNNGVVVSGGGGEFDAPGGAAAWSFHLSQGWFAIGVVRGSESSRLVRRDRLISRLVIARDLDEDAIAPLIADSTHSVRLPGWRRAGPRFHKSSGDGWISLRFFNMDLREAGTIGELQASLEAKLKTAGLKRTAGERVAVAGKEGFNAEYFGDHGVQRIIYAQLGRVYVVGLLHAPVASRDALKAEASGIAANIAPSGVTIPGADNPYPVSRVGAIRATARVEDGRLLWGAMFDSPAGEPVYWREPGVAWRLFAFAGSKPIADAEGVVSSSRDLNPLVGPQKRAIELPHGTTGELTVQLKVGIHSATAKVAAK